MSSREEMLRRIRSSLGPGGATAEHPAERAYRLRDGRPREELVEQFAHVLGDYRATVTRVSGGAADVAEAVGAARRGRGAASLVVPKGFPESWLPEDLEPLTEEIDADGLAAADGVITTCALAVAQTGTIVLDGGPGQGRRALTLIPDYHLCLVRAEQIVGLIPEAVEGLRPAVAGGRPLTFISGPSATSDIELNRVEGVHGPRNLEVLLID